MIEPVYVPYEHYRAAKTGCGLDPRIYGIYIYIYRTIDIYVMIYVTELYKPNGK
jgi:hypothetical protein